MRIRHGLIALIALSVASWSTPSFAQPVGVPYRFQAADLPDEWMESDDQVNRLDTTTALVFTPRHVEFKSTAVLFFPGAMVDPLAYAGLARGIAAGGHRVFVVKVPGGFQPVEAQKQAGLTLGRQIQSDHPEITRWCIAGHSLGGAIAARFANELPEQTAGLVLIGTTHPRDFDLSDITIPVTKLLAEHDRVAPSVASQKNQLLLPKSTIWIHIPGGNHAQFGHYGNQPGDGVATIKRSEQQALTVKAIDAVLAEIEKSPTEH